MNKCIWYRELAQRYMFKTLSGKGYTEIRLVDVNRHGHCFYKTNGKNYEQNFYLIFKKEFFNNFKVYFPDYNLKGESINMEYMDFCTKHGCKLIFAYMDLSEEFWMLDRDRLKELIKIRYPECVFSEVPTEALLKIYCTLYSLYRGQDKPNKTTLDKNYQEITYCFPIDILKRFD